MLSVRLKVGYSLGTVITSSDYMAKVIALFNQSGGVGKSTLTMNLGYHLAKDQRVLLIDMDPQASLTLFMGLEPSEISETVYDAIIDGAAAPIQHISPGIDLLPSNINLSGAELELVSADMRDYRLKDVIEAISDRYDFILIDCPPSLGLLSYISLVAANYVLVPVQTQYKSFMGTELLLQTVGRVQKRPNRQLKIVGFVPTMYSGQNSQDTRAVEAIESQLGKVSRVFPPIKRATAFADAVEKHLPLFLYDKNQPALKILDEIAQYLQELTV
jgi:chromosome partitioning protein